MPHICMDEILLFMAMVPFVSAFFSRIHRWWHLKYKHQCHTDNCNSVHADHEKE